MTYGYSHPTSSYTSVTWFQVTVHILRDPGHGQFLRLPTYGGIRYRIAAYRTEEFGVLYLVMFRTIYLNAIILYYAYLLISFVGFLLQLQYPIALRFKAVSEQGRNPSCTQI